MAIKSELFFFPVGRLVWGSLYTPRTKDEKGVEYKSPRFNFGVAIPKGNETHFSQTTWGQQVWAIAHQGHPQAGQVRDFAFKVIDGDSAQLNKKGKAPKDQTGYPGHWVLAFGGTIVPQLAFLDPAGRAVKDIVPDATKPGDYVQVYGSVGYNGSTESPGVYLNYSAVCRMGYGERIESSGVDVSSLAFGGQLPPGASQTPQFASLGGAPTPTPAVPAVPVATPAPTPVVPNGAALGIPAVPVAPPVKATVPGCPYTYQQLVDNGWSDAQMVGAGYLAA